MQEIAFSEDLRQVCSWEATYVKVKLLDTHFRLYRTDAYEFSASLYATISASFVIEQEGLPHLSTRQVADQGGTHSESRTVEVWNDDIPQRRLEELRRRLTDRTLTNV